MQTEFKSLKKAFGKRSDIESLAETCVCFANAQGGTLLIGVEDTNKLPPSDQKISLSDLNKLMKRLRDLTNSVAITNYQIHTHANGGQFLSLQILPSTRIIATTSSGKVFTRISDSCYPVIGEELTDLAAEKNAFQWELVHSKQNRLNEADEHQIDYFIKNIRASDKVSSFIKNKSANEILEHYQLITTDNYLTNLGVLWIGTPNQRARISYPITLQYLVYNVRGEKIRERKYHSYDFNPMQLILDIEQNAVELAYYLELPHGLYRERVYNYPKEVIRELLINAIAHKRYTSSGDIFIEVHPSKVIITNPGGLPIGVSKNNILHERHRRNPHLIKTLHDLKLMEGEGSGYDLIFEKLSSDAKPLPEIESSFLKLSVTIFSDVINYETLSVLDYVNKNFILSQKAIICLGIIATHKKLLSTELTRVLQLSQSDKVKEWVAELLENKIIISRGSKKATAYLLNHNLFSLAKLNLTPGLKTIELHQLKSLILEDIKINGESGMREIENRLSEAYPKDIQKAVYRLVKDNKLTTLGA